MPAKTTKRQKVPHEVPADDLSFLHDRATALSTSGVSEANAARWAWRGAEAAWIVAEDKTPEGTTRGTG